MDGAPIGQRPSGHVRSGPGAARRGHAV